MRQRQDEIQVLDQKAAAGIGNWILVEDFRYLTLTIDTASNANLTVKLVGSNMENTPDPTAAQSQTNRYDYLQMVDYENSIATDGDTGFSVSGTDDHRIYNANIDGIRWVTLQVTAYSAGNVSAYIKPFN